VVRENLGGNYEQSDECFEKRRSVAFRSQKSRNGISYYAMNPVAGGCAEAAAPCRLVQLGRRIRLLSRGMPSRRQPLPLSLGLAPAPGREHAARRGQARRQKRRIGGRFTHADPDDRPAAIFDWRSTSARARCLISCCP